jgi:hypothetical protein
MRAVLVAVLLSVGSLAAAQPMMVDPSRMSGIPRPDPQVPAGTVTVRLIRGELSNRVTNHDVELATQDGQIKTAKTDEEGRATFSGLTGGPFQARAKDDDGTALVSQSIELPPNAGVRVMLVFPKPGGDLGTARPDKTVAAGTVIVKAQDGDGKPLTGLEVVLAMMRAGEEGGRQYKGRTDDKGEAKFDGLDAKPNSGYLAEVLRDGTRYASKPFKMVENMGSRVGIEVRPISKDVKQLQIGSGSHFILEIVDDAVQVVEVWRLQNTGTTAVELQGGLHLPLPDKAVSVTPGPQSPPSFTAAGHEAVFKGPIPPGDTELQVMYVLAYQGDRLEIKQSTPVPFTELNVVTEKVDGMSLESPSTLNSEPRELQGRTLMLYRGAGTTAGGEISLTMLGLPHSNPIWRYLAAAAAVLILLGFGAYAAGGSPVGAGAREKLEQRRDHLMEELAALEKKHKESGESDSKRQKKRDELTDKLAKLYKEIDEVSA